MNVKATYSEQELVTLLQQRHDRSFVYLYENYSGALYGIIMGIIPEKETADDVLQEVFINIWKKVESYDPSKGRLFTWMLNIARNASIDKLRSKGYQNAKKNQSLSIDQETGGMGDAIATARIEDVGLRKVWTRLKNEQRVLIDLSYFQGYTHEEIAKTLGIPLGTVKTRIRSALTTLRTMLR